MTHYEPTKLDWCILAGLTALTLLAMCSGCSKAETHDIEAIDWQQQIDQANPSPFAHAVPAAPPSGKMPKLPGAAGAVQPNHSEVPKSSIPSNSTGLEKPVKPSVLYASSNGKRWLIVTRELAVKRGSNRCWRVTLDAKIGADWVISELQTDPFDGSAPMPSPMLGAESSYGWSATFDEPQAKQLADHKRESIRVDVNLVPRAGPSPDHEKAFEYLKSHPDAVRVEHFVDANKMVAEKPIPVLPKRKQAVFHYTKPDKVKLRFYTAKHGCQPCKVFLKWREENASTVDCPMEHLQFESMAKASAAFPEGIPRFELTLPDGSVQVRTGWSEKPNHDAGVLCPGCLRAWVRAAKGLPNLEFDEPAADQRVAAAGPGGAIKARAEVVRAFAFLRANVGENVPMTFRWARTGLQTFPVYGAPQNWSIEAICGKYGFVELSAPGCKLPVDHASVKYDVSGDKIGIETRIEFDLPNGSPKASARPVGLVDPASLMTIFSVIRGVWAIFKTRVSVDLGGNVEAKAVLVGDVLAVDFSQGPSVRIESLFSFYVAVKRVELTTDKCRVLFSGSRFIRERTFNLN